MKIAPRDIGRVLANPGQNYLCFLLHGADIGLIRERGTQLARHFCDDLDDPFKSVSLRGQDIAADPARLADECGAIAIFGGEKLVRLQGSGKEILEAVKNALPSLQQGTRLIIEASDTTTKHALVKLCESDGKTASIGCYADEDKDIGQMAQAIFAKDAIRIDQEAMSLLTSRLGGDRLASRSEIEKLALMAGPNGHLTVDDIDEAIGDSSAQAIDLFVKSVLTGQADSLSKILEKARQEDIAPIAILRQFNMVFRQLYDARTQIEKGESASQAIARLRPPIHFKTKPLMTHAAQMVKSEMVLSLWQRTIECEAELKSGAIGDAHSFIGQTLLGFTLRLRPKNRP